ncbi:MAG TPA: oligosaccharide flippase family protein [Candidatus Angelobacter sp.]|nr:oligosaccharide flippase family protein [Candidatus Angelobacter sp.]
MIDVDAVAHDATAEPLQTRAARGAAALLVRSGAIKLVSAAGGVVLARLLAPAQFGVYVVAAFCVAFLAMFADVGLGGALIQQREAPTRRELSTVFTVQMILAGVLVAVGLVVAAPVASAYHLPAADVWLLRALIATLFISSLRTVPAVLLERELRYGRLGTVETVEALVFQVTAVGAALAGAGVWAFVLATALRAVVGLAVIYRLSPWRPSLGIDRAVARRLASFGLAYQANGVLSFVKDAMTPTIVAVVAGAAAVGYVNWAYALATLPLLVTTSLWQVTFPAFARAAHDPALLTHMIERAIRLGAIVMLPLSFSVMALAPEAIHYVFTSKWDPGLLSVYLFSISLWAGPLLGSTFFSLFYAVGKPRYGLWFTILYGVLDWGLGVPLLLWLGFNGIAVRTVIVAYVTLPLLLRVARSIVPIRPLRQVIRPALAAALAALVELGAVHVLPRSPVAFVAAMVIGAVVYIAAICKLEGELLRPVARAVLPARFQAPLRRYLLDPVVAA